MPHLAPPALASWERDRLRASVPDHAQALRIVDGMVDLARQLQRWPERQGGVMSERATPAGLLVELARVLDEAGLGYMVIGGQAVLRYGEPRLTRDVDIALAADPARLADVLAVAAAAGLDLDPLAEQTAAEHWVLPCSDPASGFRVDLIFSWTPFEQEAIARAQAVAIAGHSVRFVTMEDLVVQKIFAGRPRDLDDVLSILLMQPTLDRDHVRRWLAEFELALDRPLLDDFARLVALADAP